jgi:hypothetical protein
LRKGVLLGLAVLVLTLPPLQRGSNFSVAPETGTVAESAGERQAEASPPRPRSLGQSRVAQFGKTEASADARHVANWALHSGDYEDKAVVIVDKRHAKVFVFSPEGKLISAAPALLGSAVGDHTVPGIGDKPLSQVMPDERTTPAGRFVAEPGRNTHGEDIIWVDYDAAVSMHRVRPNVKAERRLQRLASATPADNRISFGCINLPVAFYEKVLSPTVHRHGAIVYVLPEVQSAQALFGSYDLQGKSLVAQR